VHSIRVVHEGFAPAELAIETAMVGPPVPLRFTLQPLTASLRIDADPSASLEIDGRLEGMTPLTGLRISPGIHRVALKRPGFQPWLRTIDAKPGETLRLEARLSTSTRRGSPDEARLFEKWVQVGDLVELGPGVTPPRKIAGAPASYPEAARRLRLKGSVTVEMLVTERGEVADARVVKSAGELLDDSLLSVVRDWRYEAAQANGVKVRVRILTRQTFG
jgi:TonB family protein